MNHAAFLELTYEDWVPYYLLVGDLNHCTYCGEKPKHRDHVIPRRALFPGQPFGYADFRGLVTPACVSCNVLLGSLNFPLFLNRCELIQSRYTAYLEQRKIDRAWSEDQLAELDYSLVQHIKHRQHQKIKPRRDMLTRKVDWQRSFKFREILLLIGKQVAKEHPALEHYLCTK